MTNKIYELIKTFIKNYIKLILLLAVVLFLILFKLPYVVYSPGSTINVSNRINVSSSYDTSGSINMAYVAMREGTIPNILISYILPNWDLEKKEDISIGGTDMDLTIKYERIKMKESIDNAIINAYKKAGRSLSITENNVYVSYISDRASTDVELLDKILKVDNKEVSNIDDIISIVSKHQIGDVIDIEVERGGVLTSCFAKTYNMNDVIKIGISVVANYEYETDPIISFESKASELGSSGGLMISLAVYNKITEKDITHGKKIVGTGTIDINGNVGPVDGIKYKLLGAIKNRADIFICPQYNYEESIELIKQNNYDIDILGVETFDETIDYLSMLKD